MAALLAGCARSAPFVVANDFQHPAGTHTDSTTHVHLVAQRARWQPDTTDEHWVDVEAFGEEGYAPSIPGPLIRVPAGGRIQLSVENTLHDTLLVIGFGRRLPGFAGDTLRVLPGATREVVVAAPAGGTWAYYAETHGAGPPRFPGQHQLAGVLQVGDPRSGERLLALNISISPVDSSRPQLGEFPFWTINGRTWPSTERFTYDVGDTVRWRVVDLSGDEHPMHLHGFHFRVDERSTWDVDSMYPADRRREVVTEPTPPVGSFAMTWVPTRPGAWLFHCHKTPHMNGLSHRAIARDTSTHSMAAHQDITEHLRTAMGGLVMGITVRGPAPVALDPPDRRIRLLVQRRARVFGDDDGFGYVVQEGAAPAGDSIRIPGPVITVTRGEATEITVVNHLPYMTTVHWHGIELESYYDGVAGWSGVAGRVTPMLEPGDSFVVLIRPPRAGTFIYHAHVSEEHQITRGLLGALLVLEPGQRFDPATDHVVVVHEMGEGDSARVVANGLATAAPIAMSAGVRHRLRFVTLIGDAAADITLRSGTDTLAATASWRPVAKDGALLPATLGVAGAARIHLNPGETFDAQIVPQRGSMLLDIKSFNHFTIPIIVK